MLKHRCAPFIQQGERKSIEYPMEESCMGMQKQREARWPLLCLTTYWGSCFAGFSRLVLTWVKYGCFVFFPLREEGFVRKNIKSWIYGIIHALDHTSCPFFALFLELN